MYIKDHNKLYLLDLGRMKMPRGAFLGDLDVSTPAAQEIIEFPISASLIDGPEGRILYDTGCHPDAMKEDGRWPASFQAEYPWSGSEECELPNRLEQLGLGPNDIDYVVLSHMHSDHAGCVEFFKKSQVIVHRAEYQAAMQDYQTNNPDSYYATKDISHWVKSNLNWRFIESDESELALTSEVTLLNWGPGHSAGMLGLELSLAESGNIILASDAAYSAANYGLPARPSQFMQFPKQTMETLEVIRTRAERTSADVWFGHDLDQFLNLRRSTEGWYE